MSETFGKRESEVIEAARAFADARIRPDAESWELGRRLPRSVFDEAAAAGMTAYLLPADKGGAGLGHRAACRVAEILAAADFGLAFALKVHANAVNTIARRGTPEQQDRLLPDMIAGRRIGAFCLTEPGVGSDAAAITARGVKADDGWRVDGDKAWVTNGTVADLFSVYVQTDPAQGWRGIANLIVEADAPAGSGGPGVERGAPYTMIGGHAAGLSDVRFTDCRVPDANLLLAPGEGFKGAMAGINMARMFVAALCCGMMADSLHRALEYTASRRAFGRPVLANQGLQWELADVATDLEAARLLTDRAAAALDAGEPAITEAAHAKKFTTRAAVRGISVCMQAMGAVGLRSREPFARHLAAAKMCEFLDGTTQIQNIVISRDLVKPFGVEAG